LLNNLFLLERSLAANKARLKYFKTYAQYNLQINFYFIEEYLYLLIKCELIEHKANFLEIATWAEILSFIIGIITDKRKLSRPKKVIKASKIINIKEPESKLEEVRQVISFNLLICVLCYKFKYITLKKQFKED